MTNYIWVTLEKEHIHNYPDAPMEVVFLRKKHRHIFKMKVWLEIFHNDRDVEFIMFKNYIMDCLINVPKDIGSTSCEDLADNIHKHIKVKYKRRKIKIEVSEDGENGIIKSYMDVDC